MMPASPMRTALLLAAAASLAAAAPLLAHPNLTRSVPSPGDTLRVSPRELRLTFSEAVERSLSSVRLLGEDGRLVPLPAVSGVAGDPLSLTVAIADSLAAGDYTVAWQAAGTDGHPVRGRFTFTVARSPAGEARADRTAPGETRPGGHHPGASFPDRPGFGVESAGYVAIRWLSFTALLGILGVVGFEYLVARPVRRRGRPGSQAATDAARERAAVLGAAAAALLIAGALARLVAQAAAMQEPGAPSGMALLPTILPRTVWGWGWLLQVVAAAAALATFLRMRRDPARGWTVALVAAAALAVTPALAGHAAAARQAAPLPVVADSLHVLGAGGWLGTLFALLLAGVPAAMRLDSGARVSVLADLVNAFSPAALVFAGLAAATGLFATWLHLGSLPALWQSGYGRTLLLKLGILTGVAATGFYNWRWVRPVLQGEHGAARLRRSAGVELLIALGVILVTAVLVATPPPGEAP